MIGVFNGPQGIYVAGEGLEQRLFQLGNNIVFFDGEVCPRLVRGVSAYQNDLASLCGRIASEYDKGSVFVCARRPQRVYSVGKREIKDVSQGICSNEVVLKFSGNSLNDFVDFVEHSQSSQFGFVLGYGACILASAGVVQSIPSALYARKELCEFSKIALSWFNRCLQSHPNELRVFLQNLCALDVDKACAEISSCNDTTAAHDVVVSKLLVGTSYFELHRQHFDDVDRLIGIQEKNRDLSEMDCAQKCYHILFLTGVLDVLESKGYVTQLFGADFMPQLRDAARDFKECTSQKHLKQVFEDAKST